MLSLITDEQYLWEEVVGVNISCSVVHSLWASEVLTCHDGFRSGNIFLVERVAGYWGTEHLHTCGPVHADTGPLHLL